MKKVLLISNAVFHYRLNNYNYFYKRFRETGTEFSVLTNQVQPVDFEVSVPVTVLKPDLSSYIRFIATHKPECIILFMHLKDKIIFPLTYYCRLKKIPVIYWNFGIDLGDPDNKIKNMLYRHLHCLANAILLYSPMEKGFIRKNNHVKTFVANNTINMTDSENIPVEPNYLREKYGIKEKHIVLFVGRIIASKRVEVLLRCFRGRKDVAVVLAGRGIPDEMKDIVNTQSNYYYLGEIKYDKIEIARVYQGADVICIPGNVGLAIVEAFFWGKPLVTLVSNQGLNSPEIWYLKEGENGFIARDEKEMEQRIDELFTNTEMYRSFSRKAMEIARTDSHISKMYEGFREAVEYVTK
jgi:glycosyltransferase involved in cell wall biosynthesis